MLTKLLTGRSGWPRRFLSAAAWAVGVRPKVVGGPLNRHTLLISNHVSWLDILILGGATGTAFVSKDNLGHGVIHWLADQNHTLYVRREDRKGSMKQAEAIARAAEREQPIVLFPEGTTGPGDHLLPFRSSLLEAAAYARGTWKCGRWRSTMAPPQPRSAGTARAARTMSCGFSAARVRFR
ncbi:1-acyl-sn-glycerol-3-phosphate acyltransferase [Sphingomonas daechungensis]|uniref:1-acyl-sn-glycerol-3-phosphate acyltransferase n=1 Tax=Sphingomonas daechungensis TaxID=1176646 RepID=A0ABX6T0N7_9SPHN|nr:lysophospholipid acyltransferase family protein [Sphingomonas daechungensis]QNP42293.1 1-acyl-sn-glycerol-3-phosphate acyltransferase [Sphingomonas daechungensis]